jgi:hypothetical protein
MVILAGCTTTSARVPCPVAAVGRAADGRHNTVFLYLHASAGSLLGNRAFLSSTSCRQLFFLCSFTHHVAGICNCFER